MVGNSDYIAGMKDAMVFLAAAGIVVPLFQRLRINSIIGFILVGVAVGPNGLGALVGSFPWLEYVSISEAAGAELFGELGVVFLMFTIGLELSPQRVWALRRHVFGLGISQVAITAMAIATAIFLIGWPVSASVILGLALSFSSTAIVMQLLISQHRLSSSEGQLAFSILLCQDIMVIPVLFAVGVLANGADATASSLVWVLGRGTVAVVFILLAAYVVVRPLLRAAARAESHELFIAVVLLVILATAFITGAAGLSMALGAFVAGLAVAESEFRHQVEVDIEPFKGLLLGVFFTSIGMKLNLGILWDQFILVAALAIAVLVIKVLIVALLVKAFGETRGTSVELGLLLAHGGEFSLAVVSLAGASALFGETMTQVVLAAITIGMATVPIFAGLGARAGAYLDGLKFAVPAQLPHDLDGPVIIGGYGRVGQAVARILDSHEVPFVVLETNPTRIAAARRRGLPVFFGDASRAEVLMRAGANRAPAFVVTMDNPRGVERMVRSIRREWPTTPIFARAKDGRHAQHLQTLGVTEVIPEALEGSLQLAAHVLDSLGLSDQKVTELIALERKRQHDRYKKEE